MVRAVSTRGLVQWKTDEFGLEQVNTVIKKPYVTKSHKHHILLPNHSSPKIGLYKLSSLQYHWYDSAMKSDHCSMKTSGE